MRNRPADGASTRSAGPPLRSGHTDDAPTAGAVVALVAASQLAATERTAPFHFPDPHEASGWTDSGTRRCRILTSEERIL